MEQKRKVDSTYPQFLHGIPFMAKESGVNLQTELSGETLNIPWEEIIHKRVPNLRGKPNQHRKKLED